MTPQHFSCRQGQPAAYDGLARLCMHEASRTTHAEVVAQIAAEPAIQVSDEEIARYLAVERPQ